jgi:hypothetical protein
LQPTWASCKSKLMSASATSWPEQGALLDPYTQIWRNIAVPFYSIVFTWYIMVKSKVVRGRYMYVPGTYKYGGGNVGHEYIHDCPIYEQI